MYCMLFQNLCTIMRYQFNKDAYIPTIQIHLTGCQDPVQLTGAVFLHLFAPLIIRGAYAIISTCSLVHRNECIIDIIKNIIRTHLISIDETGWEDSLNNIIVNHQAEHPCPQKIMIKFVISQTNKIHISVIFAFFVPLHKSWLYGNRSRGNKSWHITMQCL